MKRSVKESASQHPEKEEETFAVASTWYFTFGLCLAGFQPGEAIVMVARRAWSLETLEECAKRTGHDLLPPKNKEPVKRETFLQFISTDVLVAIMFVPEIQKGVNHIGTRPSIHDRIWSSLGSLRYPGPLPAFCCTLALHEAQHSAQALEFRAAARS